MTDENIVSQTEFQLYSERLGAEFWHRRGVYVFATYLHRNRGIYVAIYRNDNFLRFIAQRTHCNILNRGGLSDPLEFKWRICVITSITRNFPYSSMKTKKMSIMKKKNAMPLHIPDPPLQIIKVPRYVCVKILIGRKKKVFFKYHWHGASVASLYGWFRQILTSDCTWPSSIWLPLFEYLLSPKRTLREFFKIF